MASSEKNIQVLNYFEKIKCDITCSRELSEPEQLDYLNRIFSSFIRSIPFHNFALRSISHSHPLWRKSLRLFDYHQYKQGHYGGFCFQISYMLYEILKYAEFDVHCSIAKVLNGLAPDSDEAKKIPATHLVLVVNLADQIYLLDPSGCMVMNGVNKALVISPDEEDSVSIQNNHLLRVTRNQDGYVFYREVDTKWLTIMQTSLAAVDNKTIKDHLIQLERFPLTLGIRDIITLVIIATDNGAKSLLYVPEKEIFLLRTIHYNLPDKEEVFSDIDKAYKLMVSKFKMPHLLKSQFVNFCLQTTWPQAKSSLEVSFPIDGNEIKQLKQCY